MDNYVVNTNTPKQIFLNFVKRIFTCEFINTIMVPITQVRLKSFSKC